MSNGSNNLKEDFKEFINTLAIEICKEVLLEEMKIVHEAFKQTEENYNYLYLNNKYNVNKFETQVEQLEESTNRINKFSNDITQQTATVSAALKTIRYDNQKVIDNIVNNNDKLFKNCTEKIQTVNTYEREKFLCELENRLKKYTDNYFEKIEETLNSSILEDINQSLNTIVINQEKDKVDIHSRIDNTTLRVERGINYNVNTLQNKVKELSELTLEFDQKIKMRTTILLSLNIGLIILFVIFCTAIIWRVFEV